VATPTRTSLLIVAPHCDDAVLSCSALLERDEPVCVLNLFAGGPDPPRLGWWDRRCGFATSTEATAARREEELAAHAGTPHEVVFMDLLAVQYVDGARPAADGKAIGKALADWVERNDRGSVALPAAAGWTVSRARSWLAEHVNWRFVGERPGPPRHPDHLFARDASLAAIVPREGVDVLLYEDLPYSWGRAADAEVRRVESAWSVEAEPFELPVDRGRKATRIAHYTSQIEHISLPNRRLDDPDALPAVERYWRLARAPRE
jgi:LmbE family N-acetylglucosaminyl deacetylase